jgi:hypothetical protein
MYKRYGVMWYLGNVKKYADQANDIGLISVSVEQEEISVLTKEGYRVWFSFRDVNSAEKLNEVLARHPFEENIQKEFLRFCRDGLMVGMHTEYPDYWCK